MKRLPCYLGAEEVSRWLAVDSIVGGIGAFAVVVEAVVDEVDRERFFGYLQVPQSYDRSAGELQPKAPASSANRKPIA